MTTFYYNGLTSSVIGGGAGEDEDERRMLSWQQQDQMGRTTLLRSYTPGGDEWTLSAEISLNYDTRRDRLTQVYRRDGGERRWQRTSSIGYDFLGRKTSMSDADLGNWSYAYNTSGQLTRQTDARDQTSCLYYDEPGAHEGPRAAHRRELRGHGGRPRPGEFLQSTTRRAACRVSPTPM